MREFVESERIYDSPEGFERNLKNSREYERFRKKSERNLKNLKEYKKI